MRKSITSSLAGLALVVSMNANAGHKDGNNLPTEKAGEIVHAGVNVVINVGNLVVSFSEAALKAFPALAEHANELVKCFDDRMKELDGKSTTAPILCPLKVGTEMVTAIILTGVSGVQEVIAVPTKFAKDIANIMLNTSEKSWEAFEKYTHIPGFFIIQLGVCVASQAIGRAAQAAAWVLETVSTTAGKAVELVVDGIHTGITYASDAVVILVDSAMDRICILGHDAHGAAKTIVLVLHDALKGDFSAAGNGILNVFARVMSLPIRVVMNQSFEDMTTNGTPVKSYCDIRWGKCPDYLTAY